MSTLDNLSIQKIPDDFDELSLKTVGEAIQKAKEALTISKDNEQQLSKIPEFEATEFEELEKEYKGGSMRYLYDTSSFKPEKDHLYIYNDKPANSSLQPDGTVGTPVGWVELAFKHDITAVSEKLESKTDKTDYADTENAGLIRLSSYDGKNNSGLVVNSENGITYVNVRQDWGISRDSEGQIGINPATQTEVNAGTEERKPVTPKTLKTAVKTYEYRASDMTTGSLGTMRISFNDIELNRLFVLDYDDDSTGITVGNKNQEIKDNQLLLYNDEIGYIVYGGFMEKGKKYLCMLTKYTVSGADPEDGELEVISEMQTAYTDTIKLLTDTLNTKADKQTEGGGFIGGNGASASSSGVAIGKTAKVFEGSGTAIGGSAKSVDGGLSIGSSSTSTGRAVAVGPGAEAIDATAIGYNAKATEGIAIGQNAKATGYNSIQIGAGTNPNDGTLQIKRYQLLNEDGQIPEERLPENFQNLMEYSSTPVQIGTWVDGTPVWRWAFEYTFTDEDKSSTSGSIFSEKLYYIPYNNFLAKDHPVRLLDYNFLLTVDSDNPCLIDDVPIGANSRYQQSGGFSTSWVVELPESGLQNFTGISGWIEFATPESNIKITR